MSVCLTYWLTGFVPREVWFGSLIGSELIQAKGWIWPTAIFDAVTLKLEPWVAALILYGLNGVTYSAIAIGLLAVRVSILAYCILALMIVLILGWYNVAVLQSFSWLGLILVISSLISIAIHDLKSNKRG